MNQVTIGSDELIAYQSAAENCELFRQRLAKYEDAEGRPVIAVDCAGLIGGLREMAGHVFNSEHRLVVAAADTLESQAREIERLTLAASVSAADANDAERELAALKAQPTDYEAAMAQQRSRINASMANTLQAQPSGVVLPERDDRAAYEAFYTERARTLPLALGNAPLRYSGGQYINDFALFGWMVWEACLSEVARLNSSHVSACEPCMCGGNPHTTECLYEHFLSYSGLIDHPLLRYAYFHGAGSGCDKPAASAGGVDERSAFEAAYLKANYPRVHSGELSAPPIFVKTKGGEYDDPDMQRTWIMWQARAALSAPSHGEQVRELPPFAQKVICKLKRFEECAEDSGSGGVDIGRHWLDLLTQLGLLSRVQRSPGMWEISQQGEDLLAAAPSAGSQGGDV